MIIFIRKCDDERVVNGDLSFRETLLGVSRSRSKPLNSLSSFPYEIGVVWNGYDRYIINEVETRI